MQWSRKNCLAQLQSSLCGRKYDHGIRKCGEGVARISKLSTRKSSLTTFPPGRPARTEPEMDHWRRFFRNCSHILQDCEILLLRLALVVLLVMGLIYAVREAAVHLWASAAAQSMPPAHLPHDLDEHPLADCLSRQRVTTKARQASRTCQHTTTVVSRNNKAHGECNCRPHKVTSQKSQ